MTGMQRRRSEPLTMHEVYLLKAMNREDREDIVKWDGKKQAYLHDRRSAANARRFIAQRRGNLKYVGCVKAYERFQEALESKVPQKIIEAVYHMQYVMKYQGYLQMELILAEARVKGMSEEEIAAMMMGDAI